MINILICNVDDLMVLKRPVRGTGTSSNKKMLAHILYE